MLVIACAADCKKDFYYDLERKASREANFIFEHIAPFTWANMIDWELSVARAYHGDIVCFVDAWDFIMQGTAQDIIAALGNSDLLFHSEAICWPEPHKADRYPVPPMPNALLRFRYVNGTGPCGYGTAIAEAIEYGQREFPIRGQESSIFADNDQRFWTDVFLSGRGRIDYTCRLSVALNAVEPSEFVIAKRKLRMFTGVIPAFVHANGASDKLYAVELEGLR
jgi:hypothetical protein